MPLPADQQVVATSETLVKTLRGAFGTPESHRPGSWVFDHFPPCSGSSSKQASKRYGNHKASQLTTSQTKPMPKAASSAAHSTRPNWPRPSPALRTSTHPQLPSSPASPLRLAFRKSQTQTPIPTRAGSPCGSYYPHHHLATMDTHANPKTNNSISSSSSSTRPTPTS